LVKSHDYDLDKLAARGFSQFLGYTERQFWDRVEKFYNPELFVKVKNQWKLKIPLE
jgi:hypothetical protein